MLCSCSDGKSKSPTKPAQAEGGQASQASSVATWTMMGRDQTNNYYQPDETKLTVDNASQLAQKWSFTVSGYPPGTPTIADGKVFVLATGGLYALDFDTGKLLWKHDDISGTSTPAYADGFLYVHQASGANLYKLDAKDGSIVWGPTPTYPDNPACDGTSSPIVADGKVIVGHSCGLAEVTGGDAQTNAFGGVEAFSTDGDHLWSYSTVADGGENGAMVWSTVAVDLDAKIVFAATGNNYTVQGPGSDAIHAIDLETGARKWLTQVRHDDLWSAGSSVMLTGTDTDFGANPILIEHDGKRIVADGDKGSSFWALDRETGQIMWSRTDLSASHTPNNGGVLMNGAFDGSYFYVASNEPPSDSLLHVLDPADGHDVIDPIRLGALVWGAPSLANGLLFVPVNSELRVYNASTGEQLNSFDTGGTIAAGAAAIADGKVIVKSGLQYVFATDAQNNNQVICYGLSQGSTPASDAGAKAQSDAGMPTQGDAGAAEPTWSAIYKNILVGTGCSGAGLCHGGEAGKLLMSDKESTYKALVNVKAMGTNVAGTDAPNCADSGLVRVVPGKPDDSLLVKKIEGMPPCGLAMPPGGMLSDAQIAQIRTWISDGAQDN